MTTPVPAPTVTEAEFLDLPTSKDHLELVDGEVVFAPSPTRQHQDVLSERRSYDRLAKRLVHAEAGVRECWMVDVDGRSVEIAQGVKTVRVERDELTSPLLPGFRLELPTLWP